MASMGGVGGAFGCDGAFLLQWSHEARVLVMAGVMPGQKTDASAREIIEFTHWWAAWSDARVSLRRHGGMMTLSLYIATPSTVYRFSLN